MALDTEALVKVTPFYKAVTRNDGSQVDQAAAMGDGGERRSSIETIPSSRFSGMAKSWIDAERPQAILVRASLTSVLTDLVRSDPLEAVVRAGVSGMDMRFALQEGGRSGMSAAVSLDDVLLTDVRSRAKGNAYTMMLAPLRPLATPVETLFPCRNESTGGSGRSSATSSTNWTGEIRGSRGAGVNGDRGNRAKRRPLIDAKARVDSNGDLDMELDLASFACNLMAEPIEVWMRPSVDHAVSSCRR